MWLLSGESKSNIWGTYKQFLEAGKQVKRGEKGTMIIFWRIFEKQRSDSGKTESIPMIRYSTVFNESQTEGFEEETTDNSLPFNAVEMAEKIISGYPLGFPKPQVSNRKQAFYRPGTDEIFLPEKEYFVSEDQYYNTYFHECIHATGHKDRLNRLTETGSDFFGSHSYSKEELVAEMGASFLCALSGISHSTIENSAAYIGNWLSALRNDKKFVIQASSSAQKATDYLTPHGEKQQKDPVT